MKKIGIIVNANAKKVRKGVISSDRFREIGSNLADVRETSTFDELDGALRNFRDEKYPYIGIAGGDGTIHHVRGGGRIYSSD
jgi:diacylglycerol kinase family enzyme